jgi:undecaprenyl-diphosphatase
MLPLETFDHSAFRYCYAGDPQGALFYLMVAATTLGSGWSMLAVLPLLYPLRTRRFAVALLATLSATGVVVWALKGVIGRHRPPVALLQVTALFGNPTDHSFPSGHAAGCFAFATFVGVVCQRAGQEKPARARRLQLVSGLVFGLAGLISYSRVYLGCHFPADVVAGATLGAVFGFYGGRYASGPLPLALLGQGDPK